MGNVIPPDALGLETERAVVAQGADPLLLLMTGDDRPHLWHPLLMGVEPGRWVLVTLCARLSGPIVNMSRWVQWGDADATKRNVLEEAATDYTRVGFYADEWTDHHQGGVTGYAGRDPRAACDSTGQVWDRQVFAWKPTVPDARVEETVVLADGHVLVLTADPTGRRCCALSSSALCGSSCELIILIPMPLISCPIGDPSAAR